MSETDHRKMLSALMGEQGQDALQMLRRMERLKRLMGTPKPAEPRQIEKTQTGDIFACSRQESMITAAIPFLDAAYRKEIYIFVRLMEMRRMLEGGLLEVREKQEEPPAIRRRNLLGAVQPYLREEEQTKLQNFIRIMEMRQIMEGEGLK